MTREDLETQVSEICVAANLLPAMSRWIHSTEAARAILALIDRHENEQWKPSTEPPTNWGTKVVDLGEFGHGTSYYKDGAWVGYGASVKRWRELPIPPEGEN